MHSGIHVWNGSPTLVGTNVRVIDVVRDAYSLGLEAVAVRSGAAGLTDEAIVAAIDYCADRKCDRDGAHCEGCRLRTDQNGITSIDAFCAQFEKIVFSESPVEVIGGGAAPAPTGETLERLVNTWRGEDVWYLARRLHRRLRVTRDGIRSTPDGASSSPCVLLMEPQLPENIGMVARAMANFGLDALRLIAPRDGWPNEQARVAAAGANVIIDDARAFSSLSPAIGDLNWLCATTARQRDLRKPVLTPEQAATEMFARTARGERCGMLFGRERNGLETAEVANADALLMIPVDTRFASLNLAQAVLIVGYEWMRAAGGATLGRVTTYERPLEPGLYMGDDRPAAKDELFGLFEHLEAELLRLGFFNPPHKRPTVVQNLRTMLTRMAPTEQEVRTLRGIVATLAKGKGAGRKPST